MATVKKFLVNKSHIRIVMQGLKWAWERRSHARYFCKLAFPGLKERFFRRNSSSQAGKIVLSMGMKLVNLEMVKITARLEMQGAAAKLKRDLIFTGAQGFFLPFGFHCFKITFLVR